mgnify:CR=1 FL=1
MHIHGLDATLYGFKVRRALHAVRNVNDWPPPGSGPRTRAARLALLGSHQLYLRWPTGTMALPPPWPEEEEWDGLDWPRGDCSLRCAMRPAIEVGGGPAMPTASHDHAACEAVWYEVRCSGLVPKGAPPTPRTLWPLRSICAPVPSVSDRLAAEMNAPL